MSNSSLVTYTKISPHKNVMTNKKNKKITVHHMAGKLTVQQCGNVFCGSRQASANYGIDGAGAVGLYVEEKDRSWASANRENDEQAVTIEVANSTLAPNWEVSNTAWNKLIELCVDICKRNGIPKLIWTGDKNGTLTCHYMFAATACPGPYLKARMSKLAEEVNKRLATAPVKTPKSQTATQTKPSNSATKFKVGDEVIISKIFSSSTSTNALNPAIKKGKIMKIITGAKNPYLIGSIGWCRAEYMTAVSGSKTSSTQTKAAPSRATAMKVIASSGLNMRKSYSTSSAIVCAIPYNAKVTWDGQKQSANGYTWYHVTYGKNSGWCVSKYLK